MMTMMTGLHNLLQPGSRDERKWSENEKMKGKCRENEEMGRKIFLHISKIAACCRKMLITEFLLRMLQKIRSANCAGLEGDNLYETKSTRAETRRGLGICHSSQTNRRLSQVNCSRLLRTLCIYCLYCQPQRNTNMTSQSDKNID